jgi:cytochrome P450
VSRIRSASLLENARFNALVIVPNAVQGIFRRRRPAVAAATRADVDGWAVGLLGGMSRGHSGGPVWVRVIRDRALLLLSPADVHRALAGSPDPFAADPKPKRDGMVTFQPDALTISRGERWRNRRAFNEAVLDSGEQHRFAARFASVAEEEALALLAELGADPIRWEPWGLALRRITRRAVLGDSARDDEQLSETLGEMMSEANGMPGETSERYAGFVSRLVEYVSAAEEGSLVSLFAEAPADEETSPVGQIPHWLFASGDTLALNALRALALIAAHPRQRAEVEAELAGGGHELPYLRGCLEEAMRLFPSTPMLSRVTLAETDWGGETVPAGTQLLIPNTFLHRDRERFPYADRFAPERWVDGDAGEQWSFNHFSRGPQVCPGINLATLLGTAALATVLRERAVELEAPSIDPEKPLPHMLDYFGIKVGLGAR